MSAERDPRVDPRVGDVVRNGAQKRRVVRLVRDAETLAKVLEVGFLGGHGAGAMDSWNQIFIRSWHNWCRGAEVVQRGEESR